MQFKQFVNEIIDHTNTLNELYKPYRLEQRKVRTKIVPHMAEYETANITRVLIPEYFKGKKEEKMVLIQSFTELMFGNKQKLYYKYMNDLLNKVINDLNEHDIRIINNSGVQISTLEDCFYKVFYVFKQDHNRLNDTIKCSLTFNNFTHLYKAFVIIAKNWQKYNGILFVKDLFDPDIVPFGYRHLIIYVYCPNTNIVCQIQLCHQIFSHVCMIVLTSFRNEYK